MWPTVWRAVQCHQTQMSIYKNLEALPAGAPSGALGRAGVLSRVQPRERRPRARNGSVRRTAMMLTKDVDSTEQTARRRST